MRYASIKEVSVEICASFWTCNKRKHVKSRAVFGLLVNVLSTVMISILRNQGIKKKKDIKEQE